jgi:preprotein translocase subunit SecG
LIRAFIFTATCFFLAVSASAAEADFKKEEAMPSNADAMACG